MCSRKAMDKRTDRLKRVRVEGRGLLDSVFSWSIEDVLSKDLYKDQVCNFLSENHKLIPCF